MWPGSGSMCSRSTAPASRRPRRKSPSHSTTCRRSLPVDAPLEVGVRVTNISPDPINVPVERVSLKCTTAAGEKTKAATEYLPWPLWGSNPLRSGESYRCGTWELPLESMEPGAYKLQARVESDGWTGGTFMTFGPITEKEPCWAGSVESEPFTFQVRAPANINTAARSIQAHNDLSIAQVRSKVFQQRGARESEAADAFKEAVDRYTDLLGTYPEFPRRPEALLGLAQTYLAKERLTPGEGFGEKALPLLEDLVTNYAASDAAEEGVKVLDEVRTRAAAVKAPPPEAKPGAAAPDEGGPPPKPPSLVFKGGEYPQVDASTSAQPLSMLIACRLTGTPWRWAQTGQWQGSERLLMPLDSGSWGDLDYLVEFEALDRDSKEGRFMSVRRRLDEALLDRVRWSGTNQAYANLVKGKCDLILVARGPSADELKLAADKKAEFDVRPVALDAFVFIANAGNPVKSLTLDQIRNIYTGKITSWEEAHPKWVEEIATDKSGAGKDPKIIALQRERNSGSQETLEKLVAPGAQLIKQGALIVGSMSGPFNVLTRSPGGICYSFFFYEERMAPVLKDNAGKAEVKLLAVDGVMPGAETIAARRYPLVTEVYAVTLKGLDPKSPAARLRDWILSPEGQAVVRESGYVPLPAAGPKAP